MIDLNKEWIGRGNIGCTFASLFAKKPELVNWRTIQYTEFNSDLLYDNNILILSIQFPDNFCMDEVIGWSLLNNFYLEDNGENCIGLRYNINGIISWVQYFGKDSHVKTRQTPIPELCLCIKLPVKYAVQVGFKGILHLAHCSVEKMKERIINIMWNSSYKNTERILGHKPTIKEAAKTTYIDE